MLSNPDLIFQYLYLKKKGKKKPGLVVCLSQHWVLEVRQTLGFSS